MTPNSILLTRHDLNRRDREVPIGEVDYTLFPGLPWHDGRDPWSVATAYLILFVDGDSVKILKNRSLGATFDGQPTCLPQGVIFPVAMLGEALSERLRLESPEVTLTGRPA